MPDGSQPGAACVSKDGRGRSDKQTREARTRILSPDIKRNKTEYLSARVSDPDDKISIEGRGNPSRDVEE